MSNRMSQPEPVRLEISQGDWLLVRKRLNAGEYRDMLNYYMVLKPGAYGVDPLKVGLSKVIAYLLDWSITDHDGKPVVIQGQPTEVVADKLDNLNLEDWEEIRAAIEKHEDDTNKQREAEKNVPDGESISSATSPSLEPSAGATNGSPHLTAMSMPLSSKKYVKNKKTEKETDRLVS